MAAPLDNLQLLPFEERVLLWFEYLVISSFLLQTQRHRPFGKARLPVATPLLLCNALVPLLFSPSRELCTNIVASLITTWLTSFKVLGWVLNRGPLVLTSLNSLQFFALYSLPIVPAKSAVAPYQNLHSCAARLGTKLLWLSAICYVLCYLSPSYPLQCFLYGMALALFLELLMEGPLYLVFHCISLKPAPYFDNPHKSTSVGEFWSKRWNTVCSSTLRFLVFDTIAEGRLVHDTSLKRDRPPWRRGLGVCASFATSGAMHELMFLHFAHRFSGYWLMFFLVQGPIVIIEGLLRKQLQSRGIRLAAWAATPLTVGTVVCTTAWLFFPDFHRAGVPKQVMRSVGEALQANLWALPWVDLDKEALRHSSLTKLS